MLPTSPVRILAIESSCDDTAASVVLDGQVASSVVSTQLDHAELGGVVPELASRLHQEAIWPVVKKALEEAETDPHQLSAVAYTVGPGLLGALLVGATFAKQLAFGLAIPTLAVDHLDGHLASAFLAETPPEYPFLALIVSGGHTELHVVRSGTESERLGRTTDDAAGEAFDKIAKLLGLPYPGGPALDALAESGDAGFVRFPSPALASFDFSFSGLKTAVLYHLRNQADDAYLARHRADVAAAVRAVIVSALEKHGFAAAKKLGIKSMAVVGGVAANRLLRQRFAERCAHEGLSLSIPPMRFCTDNAAMIGVAAHRLYLAGQFAGRYQVPYATQREHPREMRAYSGLN